MIYLASSSLQYVFFGQKLTESILLQILQVIHLSTSDQSLQSHVFKGKTALAEAELWLLDREQKIQRIKSDIKSGRKEPHLKYGFKEYEIPKGPIACEYLSE